MNLRHIPCWYTYEDRKWAFECLYYMYMRWLTILQVLLLMGYQRHWKLNVQCFYSRSTSPPARVYRHLWTIYHPPSNVCHIPSAISSLSSDVSYLTSIICWLLSTVYYPPSIIRPLLSALYYPPSTIHRLPSTVYQPPSTIIRLPSSVYHPPSTIHSQPSSTCCPAITNKNWQYQSSNHDINILIEFMNSLETWWDTITTPQGVNSYSPTLVYTSSCQIPRKVIVNYSS